ncbi:DUF11 domain-containing protein [Candidatus Roizmanbacteria bacterium]|nr:DUF11 domain-containing protein [Candidatus Roizmanbacteria bacterium]
MKFLALLAAVPATVVLFFASQKTVSAQYGQPPPSLSIVVEKAVGMPSSDKGEAAAATYVDNLSPSDPRFRPDQTVYFRIKVKNTSTTFLNNIVVQDFVPFFIRPIDGPGSFNAATRTITFPAGDLAAGEEKFYYLKMQLVSQNQLPADKGLFCIINRVKVTNNRVGDEDSAQFCVEKEVVNLVRVPSSGPDLAVPLFAGELTALGIGLYLKHKFTN